MQVNAKPATNAPAQNRRVTTRAVERRRPEHNRRATDRLDPAALQANVEASIRNILHNTIDKAVHKGVEEALRARTTNDANLRISAKAFREARGDTVVMRNGVKCPDSTTVTGKLWLLYAKAGASCTLTRARELAAANGLNTSSAAIALYSWRKFHGVKNPTA